MSATEQEYKNHIKELEQQVRLLKEQVDFLTRKLYGTKSEKTSTLEIEGQMSLFNEIETCADPDAHCPAILGCLLLQAVQTVLQGELFGLSERIPGEQGPPADAGPAPEHEGHRCCCGLQRRQLFYKGVQAPDGPDPFGVPHGCSGKSSTRIKRIEKKYSFFSC